MNSTRSLPRFILLLIWLLPLGAAHSRPLAGPFVFCYGLERGGSMQAAHEIGLNTLYIDLLPTDISDLDPCRGLIRAAHQSGLRVIIGLPTCLTANYHVSPLNVSYTGSARELISFVVSRLKDEPGVTAWATGHSLERSLRYSDDDFQHYLRQGYPSLDALNAFWGATFPTWPSVTREQARQLDANLPHKVGRASIDLADYQGWAYRATMQLWLDAIRALDDRPVLTGRITLYRSLLSVPDGYDIVCVSMPPDVLETDLQTHNVHAVDLARRGGRHEALPVLRVPFRSTAAYTEDRLRDWIALASLHGARGIALEDWSLISEVFDLEQRLPARSRRLVNSVTSWRQLPFDVQPRATTAIVHSPYAEGFSITGQPIYGYLQGFLPGEPSNLLYSLRLGSRYGLADVLGVDDLPHADLSRYGTLLLPACLRLPAPQLAQLEEYVQQGGALLGDLGLGMYETGSWTALPEALGGAFGVLQLDGLSERVGDLTVSAAPARGLPALPAGAKSTGVFSPRNASSGPATDRKSWTVSGPVAEARLADSAVPLATLGVRFDKDKSAYFAGIVGRQHGAGWALFATHSLWQYWPLEDPLSTALHASLLSRRARYELVQTGLLPGLLQFSASDEGVQLLNLGTELSVGQLWSYGAEGRAYAGAITNFTAAPVRRGLPAGTALVVARVPERQLVRLRRLPLLVQPRSDEATVEVQEYSGGQIVLRVFGAGASVRSERKGFAVQGAGETSVRLILTTGEYSVAPSSRHLLTIRGRGSRITRTTVMANPRGELDLSALYREETVTLTPAL